MSNFDHIPMEIKCNIEGDLQQIILVFSNDNGKSWYEIEMQKDGNIYSLTIPSVKIGSKVLYVFKGLGINGEEFMEDNQGQFYSQIAKSPEILKPSTLPLESETEDQIEIPSESPDLENNEIIEENQIDDNSPGDTVQISEEQPKVAKENQMATQDSSIKPKEIEAPDQPTEKIGKNLSPKSLQSPVVQFANPYNHFTQEKTQEISSVTKENIVEESSTENNSGRVITAFNPYSLEDGQIGAPPTVAETFSKIMGARRTNTPEKKQSFVNKPENQDVKVCNGCKANLNLAWKVCPVCGVKVK